MRVSSNVVSSQLGKRLEDGGHAIPADLHVVYRHFRENELSTNGGDDFIDEFPFLRHQAFRDGSDVMRITLDDLKVWGSLVWKDGRKLGWGPAEGYAPVACSEGVLKYREPHASTGAEKGNGLVLSGHRGVWSMVLWRYSMKIAFRNTVREAEGKIVEASYCWRTKLC